MDAELMMCLTVMSWFLILAGGAITVMVLSICTVDIIYGAYCAIKEYLNE